MAFTDGILQVLEASLERPSELAAQFLERRVTVAMRALLEDALRLGDDLLEPTGVVVVARREEQTG